MYAVLHLRNFALQAVLRTEAGAQDRRAALFAENTKKSVVLQANATALAAGVEIGMTAPQAVARCPTLLIRTPNADAESDARAALLAVGFTVSPLIEDTAPGVCTIDLKGSDRRAYERAAHVAVTQLRELGFLASAGIGDTPLIALYAARAALQGKARSTSADDGRAAAAENASKLATYDEPANSPVGGPLAAVAEDASKLAVYHEAANSRGQPQPTAMATKRADRREISVLLVTDPASFLGPLPLAAADPPANIATILHDWGLRTFADLVSLSRDDIGRRLGPAGLALWDRARGGEPRPLHPVASPQVFAAAMDFEEEVETLEPLLFILRRFLERLTLELRTHGHVAAELMLGLKLADDTEHERSFRLPEPTADIDILFRALHTHLDSLRTDSPISGVRLRATPSRPLVRQQGLFETGLRDPHGFSETLARIVALVGSDRVGTPELEDTHRPDAIKLVPPQPVIPPPAPAPIHPITGLPLRRFRPPLPAQLELAEGKPTYLWTDQFQGAVTQIRGPWLSSGDWWQADRAWRRTEYDITLENRGIYRLVLSDRQWFVEGEYD